MKLRFHGNTLRLRLSQSDIARLGESGKVEETVTFAPGQTLAYSIEASAAAARVAASLENGSIRVMLPDAMARRWVESDEVGIESTSGVLRVIVEKDFQCLHREGVEDADGFANPLAPSCP
jgi:hypothetical protein